MRQPTIVRVSAWIEVAAGALLLIAPGLVCALVFGARPEAVGMPLGRFAGLGLLALGAVCLQSTESRSVVRDLFAFNLGVVVVFALSAIVNGQEGVLLWPAVILHTVIAAAMLPHLWPSHREHKNVLTTSPRRWG